MEVDEGGVYYRAELPFGWAPVDDFPQPQVERQMHSNAVLLRALHTLETPWAEGEREGGGTGGKAMERLEAKVDLAVDLLSQLLAQHVQLPPACPVILRATGVDWLAADGPQPGDSGWVTLHLAPALPRPLLLPATVLSRREEGAGYRIHARWKDLSDEAQDWLERILFRFHRRSIQQSHARQSPQA